MEIKPSGKKMKIGSTRLPGNLFLAPMADVTNLAFRLLCKEYGADFTYTEMINADALVNENHKSILRGLSSPEEGLFGVQLVGNSPETLRDAAFFVEEEYRPAVIDVNLGCPAKRIRADGCGSALLDEPKRVFDIIKELSESLSTPVSAKIRLSKKEEKTLEIARLIEKAGASALTVHGRTAAQMYSGSVDLNPIRAVKEELSIPVIANGDIIDEESAARTLEFTGCDGLMIGRAAMGNPFVFRRIRHYLKTGDCLKTQEAEHPETGTSGPDIQNRQFKAFETYVSLLKKYDLLSSVNLRVHAHWFTKGIRGSRHIRERINNLKDSESIIELMRISSP